VGDNIKLCLKEMGYKGANVTSVVHDKVKLLFFVNTTTNLWWPWKKDSFDVYENLWSFQGYAIPGEDGRKIL
jgi:hypothetical protein